MARKKRQNPEVGIPVANLIDVVFLLLIFFLVTSSQIMEEALIETSAASAGDTGEMRMSMRIDVTPEGPRVGIGNSLRIVSLDELHDHLVMASGLNVESTVKVAAAPQATQQQLVEVLDTCHRAGTAKVVLLGKKRGQ
jgi:biopolymer transport protein ExbD